MEPISRWVLDTNVIVSGLLSALRPPGRLLDMVLRRQLQLTIDDRIAAEYREVLSRPKFALEPSRLDAFFAILPFQHRITAANWPHQAPPDPDDVIFLEAALEASDRVLVTGNLRHYPRGCRGPVTILDPRGAWQRLTP